MSDNSNIQNQILEFLYNRKTNDYVNIKIFITSVGGDELRRVAKEMSKEGFLNYVQTMGKKRLLVRITPKGKELWESILSDQHDSAFYEHTEKKRYVANWMFRGFVLGGLVIAVFVSVYFTHFSGTDTKAELTEFTKNREIVFELIRGIVKYNYYDDPQKYNLLIIRDYHNKKDVVVSCKKDQTCKIETSLYFEVILNTEGEWVLKDQDVLH